MGTDIYIVDAIRWLLGLLMTWAGLILVWKAASWRGYRRGYEDGINDGMYADSSYVGPERRKPRRTKPF